MHVVPEGAVQVGEHQVGIEEPEHPIVENESALAAALLLGMPGLPVILSGEWQLAVRAGLISQEQLNSHESALAEDMLV